MDIKVDFAEKKDIPWVEKLDDVDEATLDDKLNRKQLLVAKMDGDLVGFLRFGYMWDQAPIVNMIQVAEGHRRQGVGTALYDFFEKIADKSKKVILSSLEEGNDISVNWHEKMGFNKVGELKHLGSWQELPEIFFIKELT